jgi:hypothetical protein
MDVQYFVQRLRGFPEDSVLQTVNLLENYINEKTNGKISESIKEMIENAIKIDLWITDKWFGQDNLTDLIDNNYEELFFIYINLYKLKENNIIENKVLWALNYICYYIKFNLEIEDEEYDSLTLLILLCLKKHNYNLKSFYQKIIMKINQEQEKIINTSLEDFLCDNNQSKSVIHIKELINKM